MHIGMFIKKYRDDNKISMAEFAKMSGISKAYVSVLEKNRDPRNGKEIIPSIPVIKKVSNAINISFDELLESLDENQVISFKETETEKDFSTPTPQVLELDRELKEPRHADWISHGERLLEEQEAESTTVNEPLYEYKVFEKLAAGNGYTYFNDGNFDIVFHDEKMDHDFASWVFGDSMEPTYLNGEVVLIKQTGFDYDGAIYAVDWDGQTYIKKVYQEDNGLRLVSLNKKYADKFAPYDEDPRIIGKIVGHFQPVTT